MAEEAKKIWRVDVTETRNATLYVLGNDKTAVREDADELAADLHTSDYDDVDVDLYIYLAGDVPAGTTVWTGGENGTWVVLK